MACLALTLTLTRWFAERAGLLGQRAQRDPTLPDLTAIFSVAGGLLVFPVSVCLLVVARWLLWPRTRSASLRVAAVWFRALLGVAGAGLIAVLVGST